jgi:hypothetical protein
MSMAIVIGAFSVAWSFDGERKRLVLGGGLGVASADLEFKGPSVKKVASAAKPISWLRLCGQTITCST